MVFKIGFTKGKSVTSQLIREITKGEVNHTFIVIDDFVYQAHFKLGVHKKKWIDYQSGEALKQEQIHLFCLPLQLFEKKESLARAELMADLKLKYDNRDIWDLKRKYTANTNFWKEAFRREDTTKLICTEFVDRVLGGYFSKNLNYDYPGELTPQEMFELAKKNLTTLSKFF